MNATNDNPEMHPQLATVREGVMRMAEPDYTRKGQVERIEPQFSARDLVLQVVKREMQPLCCDLKSASIVVAGGAAWAAGKTSSFSTNLRGFWAVKWGQRVPQLMPVSFPKNIKWGRPGLRSDPGSISPAVYRARSNTAP